MGSGSNSSMSKVVQSMTKPTRMLRAIIRLQYIPTVNMLRSPPNFSSYNVDTGALSNRNGVRGTGVLDSRPWADHRSDHVVGDHGSSGGRGV
mmetsp:Transcript_36657/g.77333  ORF Transcript_36657/g.77333 Transcript_36657/m.77333 type:complete len:92 (-) Transcript_36657:29-304(-)